MGVCEQLPAMLGADDDPSGFEPHHHAVVAEAWRRSPHWRVPKSGLVMESLVPAVIEQKVTGKEAFARLAPAGPPVRRAGTWAGGPAQGCA